MGWNGVMAKGEEMCSAWRKSIREVEELRSQRDGEVWTCAERLDEGDGIEGNAKVEGALVVRGTGCKGGA